MDLDPGFYFYLTDVDECANSKSCPEHSTCRNSLGSYSCVCNPGYVSKSGKTSFQGPAETCKGRFRGLLGIMSNLFGKTAVLEEEFEVEVGLSWVQSLVCRTEAKSHLSIHAFIQQTLIEHLLYRKALLERWRILHWVTQAKMFVLLKLLVEGGQKEIINNVRECICSLGWRWWRWLDFVPKSVSWAGSTGG